MTDEREALERIVNNVLPRKHTGIMAAADAYGDARELKGHVKTCGKRHGESFVVPDCGTEGWYCEDAPIKEGASEHGNGR